MARAVIWIFLLASALFACGDDGGRRTLASTPTLTATISTLTPTRTAIAASATATISPSAAATAIKPTITATAAPATPSATAVTPSPTATAVPPTDTPTITPTITATAVPDTPTATAAPPSPTATAEPPTDTPTITPTITATAVQDTPTVTAVPPSPTATAEPPADTPTITPTITATAVQDTPTVTAVPPSPTATAEPPTATSTASATDSATFTATSSPEDHLQVVAVEPAPRSVSAPVDSTIRVRFDRPLEPSSIVLQRSLRVFGRWSGAVLGAIELTDSDRTLVLTPLRSFSAGESVMLTLSHDVRGADGAALRPGGYAAQFWTRSNPAPVELTEIDRFSVRTEPGTSARAYGGIASDLDEDGLLDLAIVNEDSADLAVYLNVGGGCFQPPGARYPLGRRASPSEPADFDGNGHVDVAVANIDDGTVSILLGRGDGSFGEQQTVAVGQTPRGIAGLDIDGDGDTDIGVTAATTDDVAILRNDGQGRFEVATRVDTGARQEWALAAADVDEDGLLDLIVGAQGDSRIVTLKSMGDGTFRPLVGFDVGGGIWMLVTGDLNGDGHEDAASVLGRSNTAAVLFGDGLGGFSAPSIAAIGRLGLASDLGDLDGDGDLDWVTSSFSGEWQLFENREGRFVRGATLFADRAASCALVFDADADGDLDLGLIDEVADEITIMRNASRDPGVAPPPCD